MPGGQLRRWFRDQKILRKFSGKRSRRRGFQKIAQIAAHEFRAVGGINRSLRRSCPNASCTARSNAEQHNERGEPWHRFGIFSPRRVRLRQQPGQNLLLKIMSDFHRMPLPGKPGPRPREVEAEISSAPSVRCASGSALGQTHCTLSGVSPQPSAVCPRRSVTRTRTRAHTTSVNVSAPNLNGTRVRTGRK